jgi:DNA-binding response OmpR family regulator
MKTGRKSILIIEDDDFIRYMLEKYFKGYYPVLLAVDGEDGIDLYEKHRKEVGFIITDVMMPGICGDDVVEYVREKDENIPIICITAFCEEDTVKKIMNYRKVKIIKKPFNPIKLHSEMRIMMSETN